MENIDLDIQNYSINDIEKLLSLNNQSSKYDKDTLEKNAKTFEEKILASVSVSTNHKTKLIDFMKKAKKMLYSQVEIPVNPEFFLNNEHPIVEKPPVPFHYSNPSEYFDGVLNPFSKHLTTKNVNIDTLFRDNYDITTSTHFTIQLSEQLYYVASIRLVSFQIPTDCWYNVSSEEKNNTITISLYNMNGYVDNTQVITIPDGNYNETTLVATINNLFQYLEQGLDFLTISVDPITQKTILRVNNSVVDDSTKIFPFDPVSPNYSPHFYFTVSFTHLNNKNFKTLGFYLGFTEETYTVNETNTFLSSTYSLTTSVLFEGYLQSEKCFITPINNYLYLDVDDFNNNYVTNNIISASSLPNSFIGQNILARILVSNDAITILSNLLVSSVINKKRDYFGPVRIEKLSVRLLNRFGRIIHLNTDYSFVLEFTQIYC
jgi:hypothetical protein